MIFQFAVSSSCMYLVKHMQKLLLLMKICLILCLGRKHNALVDPFPAFKNRLAILYTKFFLGAQHIIQICQIMYAFLYFAKDSWLILMTV